MNEIKLISNLMYSEEGYANEFDEIISTCINNLVQIYLNLGNVLND